MLVGTAAAALNAQIETSDAVHQAGDMIFSGFGTIGCCWRCWARSRLRPEHAPVRLPNTIEYAECDQRIEFVEAFECQDGDMHGVLVQVPVV